MYVIAVKKVILLLTIDIGNGVTGTIKVHENDDYSKLAKMFQQKHKLPFEIIEPLTNHIQQSVKNLLEKK